MKLRTILRAGVAAAAAASAAHTATAQTTANTNAVNLLSPFTGLASQPGALTSNLGTAVSINGGATAGQLAQARSDNTITSDFNAVNGANIADGLGTKLNSAYQASLSGSSSSSFVSVFTQAFGLTQSDAAYVKSNTANIYGPAYNAPPGSIANPRPFLVPGGTTSGLGAFPTAQLGATSQSFMSAHSTYGYTQALLFAQAVPEAYQQVLTRASEYANSRVVLGVHYPLDVMAGRILAEQDVAGMLNGNPAYVGQTATSGFGTYTVASNFATQFAGAATDLRTALQTGCGGTISSCLATSPADRFSNASQNAADYASRLTYGLPATGPTNLAPVVPAGAEVLLATRLPYLSASQRAGVLASTELASGGALDNGSGWARLDLYKAANGPGALAGATVVSQDASLGGFNAADTWSNDIGGTGSLKKQGTGKLTLTGNNSYSGGTEIDDGYLVAASTKALGVGAVAIMGGSLDVTAPLTIGGTFLETAGSTLQFDVTGNDNASLTINGAATLGGRVVVNFLGRTDFSTPFFLTINDPAGFTGDFVGTAIGENGFVLDGVYGAVVRTGTSYQLEISSTPINGDGGSPGNSGGGATAVPEPAAWLLMLSGVGALAAVRRRVPAASAHAAG